VRAIGVIASIISTYSVKAGDKGTAGEAMKSVNKGFIIGSVLSIIGFMLLGLGYLHFSPSICKRTSKHSWIPGATAENVTAGLPVWATFRHKWP